MKSRGDPRRVSEILIRAATEFCNDEIHRGQEPDSDAWFVDQHRRATTIAGRHGHDGPAREALPQVAGNVTAVQKFRQGPRTWSGSSPPTSIVALEGWP